MHLLFSLLLEYIDKNLILLLISSMYTSTPRYTGVLLYYTMSNVKKMCTIYRWRLQTIYTNISSNRFPGWKTCMARKYAVAQLEVGGDVWGGGDVDNFTGISQGLSLCILNLVTVGRPGLPGLPGFEGKPGDKGKRGPKVSFNPFKAQSHYGACTLRAPRSQKKSGVKLWAPENGCSFQIFCLLWRHGYATRLKRDTLKQIIIFLTIWIYLY